MQLVMSPTLDMKHNVTQIRAGGGVELHLCEEVLVGARRVMQPLDEQSEELLEAQAQALDLVRPPARVGVLRPAQALDQSAVHVWGTVMDFTSK